MITTHSLMRELYGVDMNAKSSGSIAKERIMPSESNKPFVCVLVDDEESQRHLMRVTIESAYGPGEVECVEFERAERAMVDLPVNQRAVIICDYNLETATGIDWLPDFVRADIGPVILVTSHGTEEIAAEAFRHGAADYVEKSAVFQDPKRLKGIISEAQRKFSFIQANKELSRQLKVANRELEQQNTKLEQLTDTAHRFVDDVAHEFRTPLAVIKEFASILADGIGGPTTQKQKEFLEYISEATSDLASLIDDFLDSSKLKAKTLRVSRGNHRVIDVLDSVWPILDSRASAKSIQITRCIGDDLPEIYADEDKFKRSLINLVVNAIKFSNPESEVIIRVQTDADGMVVFDVIDHGPGLPAEEVKKLFNRFKQCGEVTDSNSKGFGLGLSIVKELVRINLGEVSVESVYGEGCTFSFTVPRADPGCVVESLIKRTLDHDPESDISVMRIVPVSQSITSDVVSFLASVCYPGDLVYTCPRTQRVYVAGETSDPDGWKSRIERLAPESRSKIEVQIHQVGMWPIRNAREKVLSALSITKREVQHV